MEGVDGNQTGGTNADAGESPNDTDMAKVECQVAGCTGGAGGTRWSFEGGDAVAAVWLGHHLKTHETADHAPERKPRPPPLQAPKLTGQCSEAKFGDFKKKWGFYKLSVDMPPGAVTSYLLGCLDEEIRTDVHAAHAEILTMSEDEVLAAIEQHAVQKRAISSLKVDLWRMRQDEGESVRKYYARVKELASQCQLTVACTNAGCRLRNPPYISYCDEIVKQVVISGIADKDIKKEVLGVAGIDGKNLAETLAVIEDKETAARSVEESASSSAAMTSYKKIAANDKRLQGTGKCDKCTKVFKNKKVQSRKGKDDVVTTFKECLECWKAGHPLPQRKNQHKSGQVDEVSK